MPGTAKVNGSWRDIAGVSANVNGAWQEIAEGYTKVNGAWQQWFASGGPAFELIQNISTSSSSVTFSNLDTFGYSHLQLRYAVNADANVGGAVDLQLQFNNDSNFNYSYRYIAGRGSSVQAFSDISSNESIRITDTVPAIQAPDTNGIGIIDLLDYNNSNKKTTIRGTWSVVDRTMDTRFQGLVVGSWHNTATVTDFKVGTFYNFDNATFSLYGIKG